MEDQVLKVPTQHLQAALDAKIGGSFPVLNDDLDVLEQLLENTRSANTRREYRKDLTHFFSIMAGQPPTRDLLLEFLHLEQPQAVKLVLKYKAILQGQSKSEATVNRRLAAIKSLVKMGRKLGVCVYSLEDVKGEKIHKYRDTSGITPADFKRVLDSCDRSTHKGKRDYALLRLLWCNALRRDEISKLNVGDFDATTQKLQILGKGKGTQTESIDLPPATVAAILEWLATKPTLTPFQPLFTSLDYASRGHRLTGDGIRKIVVAYCQRAGIRKQMSPHRIRHSAITAVLDATDGNVRKAQKFSRHRNLDTLMIYDDNRNKDQMELSTLLDEMV